MTQVELDIDLQKVDVLIDRSGADPEALIGILQDIQDEWNYLPVSALKRVAERLAIPENRVWAVATFYDAFTLEPLGTKSHHGLHRNRVPCAGRVGGCPGA